MLAPSGNYSKKVQVKKKITLSLHSLHSLHVWSAQSAVCSLHGLRFNMTDQCWALQRSGSTDPPKENGRKFAPTAPIASKFRLGNTL